jgi:hypothetical protein
MRRHTPQLHASDVRNVAQLARIIGVSLSLLRRVLNEYGDIGQL